MPTIHTHIYFNMRASKFINVLNDALIVVVMMKRSNNMIQTTITSSKNKKTIEYEAQSLQHRNLRVL